jgi:carbamate kinase
MSKLAVVAFGGNALVTDSEHQSIPDQYDTVSRTAAHLVDMVAEGWSLVVSHGNGPQVGFILRRSELAGDEVDPVPLDYAVADTEGAIGSMFVRALTNELTRHGLSRPVVAVVTHCAVDPDDPAFASPNKPVGSFLDEETARSRADKLGWDIVEDSGRGWRRVVASPRPQRILESETIGRLLEGGAVVVAAGAGGYRCPSHPTAPSRESKRSSTRIWPRRCSPGTLGPSCCSSRPGFRGLRSGSAPLPSVGWTPSRWPRLADTPDQASSAPGA